MSQKVFSIRPFIGAKDFGLSRNFYRELGFQESAISHDMSFFRIDKFGFYLQDAYVKDWVDNTMVFMEVEDVAKYWDELITLDLPARYNGVKYTGIRDYDWGRECFVYDPSGILWHFGQFYK